MSPDTCRFCLGNGLLSDAPIFETTNFYGLMSNDPLLPQASMVIPRRHSTTPFDMTAGEWADLPIALSHARDALAPLSPDGFTIGWNVGAVAGQTVHHTHLHVIARFRGEPTEGKGIRHPLKSPPKEPAP